MKTVNDVISDNSLALNTIRPDQSVYEALDILSKCDDGALLVVDGKSIIGVISERDVIRKVDLENRNSKTTLVSEIMTSGVISVTPNHSAEDCLALMNKNKIRHLAVTWHDGRVIGFVSIMHVIHSVLGEKNQVITQFEDYAANKWPF